MFLTLAFVWMGPKVKIVGISLPKKKNKNQSENSENILASCLSLEF